MRKALIRMDRTWNRWPWNRWFPRPLHLYVHYMEPHAPYAPPEPFDTALALLALTRLADRPDVAAMVRRGRSFLIAAQGPDGSWPETTRPSGEIGARRSMELRWKSSTWWLCCTPFGGPVVPDV